MIAAGMKKTLGFVFLMAVILSGCYPLVHKDAIGPEETLKPVRFFLPSFHDDMDRDSLAVAIRRNLEYLHRLPPETVFHYGQDGFTSRQVRESEEAFLDLLSKGLDEERLNEEISKNFRVYRVNSPVLFTGYYEPLYEGSLAPDETFKYPLYRQPDDLIKVDLSPFSDKFKGESIIARIEENRILPYYSRSEIESQRVLEGKGLEIAWLKDPLDVAFLHIQGSGRLRLPDGREPAFHYQASNGRPYRSIGRYLIERGWVPREEMSMQAIRKYLTEHPNTLDEVLNQNPSYVFFSQEENGPMGSLGVPLTPGRSIALDPKVFPRAALGFMVCRKPVVNDQGNITGWTEFSRFILNQDSGGAIKGTGRADLFWGSGSYAELAAGHMQHEGDLYILLKR